MKNKDIKTTIFMYSPYECSAVEEYLEKMGEEGWLLQSIKGAFFKFKKTILKEIKYSVDVLDRVSVFDHKDSDVALEYREYCQAAGWTYVCDNGKTQIFYTQGGKEAISIHTDEEEKFKVVFKSSITAIIAKMILIILFIFSLYMQLMGNTELLLASNSGILVIGLFLSTILVNIIGISSFYIWAIKAKGQLKKSKIVAYNGYKQLKWKNVLIIACNFVLIIILLKFFIFDNYGSNKLSIIVALIMLIPMIATKFVRKFADKKMYSRNTNMAITIGSIFILTCLVYSIVFSYGFQAISNAKQTEVPTVKANLTLVDFGYEKSVEKNSYIEFDASILAQRTKYSCQNVNDSMEYTIFESKYPLLIKLQENSVVGRYKKYFNFKEEITSLPSNIRVYFGGSSKNFMVLVSEDKVIFIVNSVGVSEDEFLKKAYEKLFN